MTPPTAIRRVTAILDAGSHGDGLLTTAVDIAARLHVEVQALVLQDTNLHRLAELGIARMVSLFANVEPILPADTLQMFQRLVSQAEAALESLAHGLGIPWSFRVLSGDPAVDLSQAVLEGELLVANIGDNLAGIGARLGIALWQDASSRVAGLLLLHHGLRQPMPAMLIAEPTPAAERALAIGGALMGARQQQLDVLLAPQTPGSSTPAWVRGHCRARISMIADCAVETVADAMLRQHATLLVVPSDAPCPKEPEQIAQLLDRTGRALLLVR